MSGKTILEARGLSVGYGNKILLEGVELAVHPGQLLTLIGPNGAGKSTILKTIARQLAPLGGTVWLDGQELSGIPPRQLGRTMSLLMTGRIEPERMRCGEVVGTGRYPYTGPLGILNREDQAQAAAAMELAGVSDLEEREFGQVSDGQRQRVMLARAICQQPRVMVLDEPTTFLDIRYKLELLELLRQLARTRGLAVVMSLHELELAQKVSDQVLCVGNGGIERLGAPEEIFSGDYISRLYGMTQGSYDPVFGCVELSAPQGAPEVFVIGGGGGGIPVYRRLQRQSIPFGAGVLQENDLEIPVARALAARLITEQAFQPVSGGALERAREVLRECRQVICCVRSFGEMNRGNRQLLELARDLRLPVISEQEAI